jgi:nicotinate-nucleotide adenylyltransferase
VSRRLGLLGGTFDPPHYGHLIAAQESAWQLELERVLFLPARQNPLKQADPTSEVVDRCRMVELAIDGNPLFALSRADVERPGPSYTVDLLRRLRDELNEGTELYFLVGADVLQELPSWRRPQEVLQLVTALVVLSRPGSPPPDAPEVEARFGIDGGRIIVLHMPGVDISSSELRGRVQRGEPIRYLTPPAVEAYIAARGMYRGPETGEY